MEKIKFSEFDLFAQRKMEDEDDLRLWFFTELLTQIFMKMLKSYLEDD